MAVSREDILHIAELARLELKEDEIESMAEDLSAILEYIERLDDLELGELEPTSNVLGLSQPMRKDTVTANFDQDEALKNAPDTDGTFFVVPRVV
jgi:aspartyl-tRNA(Asn)/glutamyl-tRNA(Gln) amidotransferase subunit C